MKRFQLCLFCILFIYASLATAATEIKKEHIRFKQGETTASVHGTIKGYRIVDYQVQAKAGQTLTADFKTSNLAAYFNVLPAGTKEAIFIGSTSGNHFESNLPTDGFYTIRVYLMRSAARRNESARYTLKVHLSDAPATSPLAFDRTLELMGIQFHVTSTNRGSINTLSIVPSGLTIDNSPIVKTIDGTITGAEVADIDADGSPEIYVYVTSAGSGSYGKLVAYSANRNKSLSDIYLPPIHENTSLSKGYRGHDEFAVLEGVIGQRFPIYNDADTNANPTGGLRQLQYKLVPGEAGWLLKIDKVLEF